MRVAYLCADRGVPASGNKGCSIHLQAIVGAFQRKGAEVELFVADPGEGVPEVLDRVPVHRIRRPPLRERHAREKADQEENAEIMAALDRSGPFDLVYERYSLWSYAGMVWSGARGVPGVLEVNAPLIEEQGQYRGLIDRAGAESVARRSFQAARLLVAVSRAVADYLERFSECEQRVAIVPNGVDPGRFSALPAVRRTGGENFTIGFVGTLKPWHGIADLFRVFERLHERYPELRLLVVGDGPEAGPLQEAVQRSGLQSSVQMTGAVAPAAIPGLLGTMDVTVAPYPELDDFYFSPLKIYEYMAAGRPTVVSRCPGLEGLVVHDQTGLLYPPGDLEALGACLERLLLDRDLGARLGASARIRATTSHSWDHRLEEILNRVYIRLPEQAVNG